MHYEPLASEEIASVIERRGAASRVPSVIHLWVHPRSFGERQQAVQDLLGRYPMDVQLIGIRIPGIYQAPEDDPGYRWVNFDETEAESARGLDSKMAISDWSLLDGILEDFPNPGYAGLFPNKPEPDGRYRLGLWWFCLFERFWSLRSMTNAMLDFYAEPENVHLLFRALTDFYKVIIERGKAELGLDGIATSDDLGMQTGPMFSPEVFREFFKPYYREIVEKAHSLGMHFWLHCCGNIEKFLPDFIEIGLDVLHPIQKHTMDEKTIARRFGKNLCIWAGLDVQQVIPWGTPEEVRREVRYLIDTYQRPDGGLIMSAGNGINGDCTLESLEAFLDETCRYGVEKYADTARVLHEPVSGR